LLIPSGDDKIASQIDTRNDVENLCLFESVATISVLFVTE
jgi:hypothetical protein